MPRVSAEHLAARRQQVLDAARRCFIRDGFHATSMQDVIAEAGLSVGAVYRYFPSKGSLVVGVAEQLATGIAKQLTELAARRDLSLVEVMESAAALVELNSGPDGALRIAVQVWSEAQRDPALAALATEMYGNASAIYVEIAKHAQERGELPADVDPSGIGATLAGLVLGYGILRLLTGQPGLETYRAGLRALLDGCSTKR
jgi:AcrR family transcriptional regulator